MDELSEAIMEEFLDQHDASPDERERVTKAIREGTKNPWDTEPLLFLIRDMASIKQ